jgi:spermidine/putrescine transport system substrate-binding protein
MRTMKNDRARRPQDHRSGSLRILIATLTLFLLAACGSQTQPLTSIPTSLAKEITVYNWEGDIPQSVLDAFTKETNIKVNYEAYESQEEAIANIRAGQVYDVVTMENRFIPLLVNEGLLAEINYRNISNFKNISPNFRDLRYDPGNRYSIPYSWGTTGLIIRSDLVQSPITRWADLWDGRYKGKVAVWVGQPRETIALTLKSLGYSANSENRTELESALKQLITLKPGLQFAEDFSLESAAPALASGKVVIAMGYSGDFLASQAEGLPVKYIMPEEGALLWGDNFVIPTNSSNPYLAELFLDFLLRPEISAEIVNQTYYASANESARAYINQEILDSPSIYPDERVLKQAEIILPLSREGQKLYDDIWQQFLDAGQ